MQFKPKRGYVVAFALLTLLGCSKPDPTFVVWRDVPLNPSFTVIPANNYLYQIHFANIIEAVIIRGGVRVIQRPATKEVITEKQLGQKEAVGDSSTAMSQEAEAKLIEKYTTFDKIKADYIVLTYRDTRTVKFIKRDTEEVLAVVQYAPPVYGPYKIQKTLEAMGVPVRVIDRPQEKVGVPSQNERAGF